ncbi:MAG: transporter [Gemmatimonadetes bacterium]|nr:transporter [Gemmatimonadota bacterium]MBT8477363.1 transporter [Gemmatimonadota bacterium]NNK47318.1 transporter [Gemmatimonadota bacterium]
MTVSRLAAAGTFACAGMALAAPHARSQELEPRLLANVPVHTNFVVAGYGFTRGNILLDPAVPIEDLDGKLHTFVGAYVRSIDLFGLSGKVDAVVPFAGGDWTGRLEGQDTARSVTGFGDPRLRLSVGLTGSPALERSEFAEWKQRTVVGAALQVIAPLGQYDPSKLINLSSNRWTFRPQVGVSHAMGPWILESNATVWLFTANSDFFGGQRLEQRPLFAFKVHGIRTLSRGWWFSLGVGYGVGGRSVVDGAERDNHISTFRFGGIVAAPLGRGHSVKLILNSGARIEKGPDFDGIALTYQYMWGR